MTDSPPFPAQRSEASQPTYSFGWDWGWVATTFLVSLSVLSLQANRIDFHPDEAIYLSKVPANLDNDSGLFFHAWYWLTSLAEPTPLRARYSCALLGALAITSVSMFFVAYFFEKRHRIAILVLLSLLISYQGTFLILRMRPEISWVTLIAMLVASLAWMEKTSSIALRLFSLSLLVCLPMNHRLAWIACIYIGGYLVLFGRRQFGVAFTIAAIVAIPLGVLIQFAVRPCLVGESYGVAFEKFLAPSGAGTRLPPLAFLHNVFFECSNAFNDTCSHRSWWQQTLGNTFINHHAIANWIWGIGFMQPFLGKTWRQRYVLSGPIFFLGVMYVAGYFNPTYFAMFSLFALLGFAFLANHTLIRPAIRWIAGLCIVLSVFNGASFLASRVLHHGRASFFDVEKDLREFVSSLPSQTTIAVSERMQSITARHGGPRFVIYKDAVPNDIDFIIADEYDFEVYSHFISDYAAKQEKLQWAIDHYQMLGTRVFPVYWRDKLLDKPANPPFKLIQGSWFFRNSVQYRIMILQRPSLEHEATLPAIFQSSPSEDQSGRQEP